MKKTVIILFLFVGMLAGWTSAYAQHSGTKWFNEVSVAGGVGGTQGGLASPYVQALYTFGVSVCDYFATGLSVGYDYGLSAQVALRGHIPFSRSWKSGLYLAAGGGAGFLLDGTIPVCSASAGLFFSGKSHRKFCVGPFLTEGLLKTDLPDASKAWTPALGLRLSYQF